jgi:hypothetical protein
MVVTVLKGSGMKPPRHLPFVTRARRGIVSLTALVAVFSLLLPLSAAGAATMVPLGTANSFAILAGSTITNTGSSTVTGDIGLHPGTEYTGSAGVTHNGAVHLTDGVALQAKNDLTTAYTNAAGQPVSSTIPTELGGSILPPGVYDSEAGTFEITGTLTLDAGGDPDAVFIFQMRTSLVTASNSVVALINGAQACNVFWQVGSSATLGTDSVFRGNILALASIDVQNGATIEGRALARNAAVTLDTATITRPVCADSTDGGGDDDGGGDGTDDDGTATDGTDTDGTDADGTDADGTADDGATGADGTDAGDTDGTADVDGTDADGTDGVVTAGDAASPGLPVTGAPVALIGLGVLLLAVGRGAVRVTRPGRHSA